MLVEAHAYWFAWQSSGRFMHRAFAAKSNVGPNATRRTATLRKVIQKGGNDEKSNDLRVLKALQRFNLKKISTHQIRRSSVNKISKAIFSAALSAVAFMSAQVQAADDPKVACSVTINYSLNNVVTEPYQKEFVIRPSTPFLDDFSTPIRQKTFSANVSRALGNLVVSIDYFNDVGVFNAIGFNTQLTIRSGVESTSGTHTFSTSQGSPSGNHSTNYSLVCARQ